MAEWLASEVPEWLIVLVLVFGLPGLMVGAQQLVRRYLPHWEKGEHNDAAGVMLSAAVVVYSVAIGLCVVNLWDKLDEAHRATEAEANNLAALAEGSRVFDPAVQDRIRAGVVAYNRDVIARWNTRIHARTADQVGADLDGLVAVVAGLEPRTPAQEAFVDDAVQRLTAASELRATTVRMAHAEQLPGVFWIAVLGGSVVVLLLCFTCGVRDALLRRVLLVGVTLTVGINLFMVLELNYPFYGQIRVGPEAYSAVVSDLER